MIYRALFELALRRVEPERAHEMAKRSLRGLRSTAAGRALVRHSVGSTDPSLEVSALGLTFSSPLGVAAGVDKDATWFDDLGALGFGFVEVGTITALAQPGNPKPRVARVPASHALVNRMGFPNPGAEVAAGRLGRARAARESEGRARATRESEGRARTMRESGGRARATRESGGRAAGRTIVGVNVGKSMAVRLQDAAEDYRTAVRRLAPVADYVVLNVSSPNTPGLREMQGVEELGRLIGAVRSELSAADAPAPLMIKIAPDLDDDQIDAIARLALELELDGIVAVNTTVDRGVLGEATDVAIPFDGGGVSGRPLGARALGVLRRLYANVGHRLVLVSVGGIETADDVWERIVAGATLVQVYTGLVYGGPAWASRVNRDLARMVHAAGASSVAELVGAGAVPTPA